MKLSTKRIPFHWGLLLLAPAIFAQTAPPTIVNADCFIPIAFTASHTTANFDNRQTDCRTWSFQYNSTGFSGVSITVQSAHGALTPSSFSPFTGTVATGINPNTSTIGAAFDLREWNRGDRLGECDRHAYRIRKPSRHSLRFQGRPSSGRGRWWCRRWLHGAVRGDRP